MKKFTTPIIIFIIACMAINFVGCNKSATESNGTNADISSALEKETNDVSDADLSIMSDTKNPKYVNITFDPNGGIGNIQDHRAKCNSSFNLPDGGFKKNGFRLAGWSTSPNASCAEYSLNGLYTVADKDVTLYAYYTKNTAKISFVKSQNSEIYGDDISHVVEVGTTHTIPTTFFSATGKQFIGWSRNPEAKTPDYLPGDQIFVSGDTVLYPVFSEIECLLIYQYGDKRFSKTIKYGEEVLLSCNELEVEGHYLAGFSDNKNDNNIVFEKDQVYKVEKNTVMYCIMEAIPVGVKFEYSDSNFNMETINAKYGDIVTLPTVNYVPQYYKFVGWATEKNSSIISYEDGAQIKLDKELVLFPIYTLIDKVERVLTRTVTVTADGLCTAVDFASGVDVKLLADSGYSKYSVSLDFTTEKVKGKSQPLIKIFYKQPETNANVYNVEGSRPAIYSNKYAILKEEFSLGHHTMSSDYCPISDLLTQNSIYFFMVATGSNVLDITNNSFNLTSCTITIQFYK